METLLSPACLAIGQVPPRKVAQKLGIASYLRLFATETRQAPNRQKHFFEAKRDGVAPHETTEIGIASTAVPCNARI